LIFQKWRTAAEDKYIYVSFYVILVEVFEREIDALIRRGLIDAERRADRGEIRAALYKLFDSTINRW
jgi:hypothetical protein